MHWMYAEKQTLFLNRLCDERCNCRLQASELQEAKMNLSAVTKTDLIALFNEV